jgi:hypothetical protein
MRGEWNQYNSIKRAQKIEVWSEKEWKQEDGRMNTLIIKLYCTIF